MSFQHLLGIRATFVWNFGGKTSEKFFKLPSICTDECFEEKLVFAEKHFIFFDFLTLGTQERTFGGKEIQHACQNWLRCIQRVILRAKISRVKQNYSRFFWELRLKLSEFVAKFWHVCQNHILFVQMIFL